MRVGQAQAGERGQGPCNEALGHRVHYRLALRPEASADPCGKTPKLQENPKCMTSIDLAHSLARATRSHHRTVGGEPGRSDRRLRPPACPLQFLNRVGVRWSRGQQSPCGCELEPGQGSHQPSRGCADEGQPGYQIPCTQRVYEGSGQGPGHFPARHRQAAGSKVQGPQGPGGAGSGLAPASPPAPFMAGSGNGRSVLRRQ